MANSASADLSGYRYHQCSSKVDIQSAVEGPCDAIIRCTYLFGSTINMGSQSLFTGWKALHVNKDLVNLPCNTEGKVNE